MLSLFQSLVNRQRNKFPTVRLRPRTRSRERMTHGQYTILIRSSNLPTSPRVRHRDWSPWVSDHPLFTYIRLLTLSYTRCWFHNCFLFGGWDGCACFFISLWHFYNVSELPFILKQFICFPSSYKFRLSSYSLLDFLHSLSRHDKKISLSQGPSLLSFCFRNSPFIRTTQVFVVPPTPTSPHSSPVWSSSTLVFLSTPHPVHQI